MKFQFDNTEFNSVEERDKNGKFTEGNNLQKRQSNTECLFLKCDTKPYSRGLCGKHYRMAWRCVKNGETTWNSLEREGKAKKAQKPNQGQPQKKWFTTKDNDWFKDDKKVLKSKKEQSVPTYKEVLKVLAFITEVFEALDKDGEYIFSKKDMRRK